MDSFWPRLQTTLEVLMVGEHFQSEANCRDAQQAWLKNVTIQPPQSHSHPPKKTRNKDVSIREALFPATRSVLNPVCGSKRHGLLVGREQKAAIWLQ